MHIKFCRNSVYKCLEETGLKESLSNMKTVSNAENLTPNFVASLMSCFIYIPIICL